MTRHRKRQKSFRVWIVMYKIPERPLQDEPSWILVNGILLMHVVLLWNRLINRSACFANALWDTVDAFKRNALFLWKMSARYTDGRLFWRPAIPIMFGWVSVTVIRCRLLANLSPRRNQSCHFFENRSKSFGATGSRKNGLSHWKRPSPLQQCRHCHAWLWYCVCFLNFRNVTSVTVDGGFRTAAVCERYRRNQCRHGAAIRNTAFSAGGRSHLYVTGICFKADRQHADCRHKSLQPSSVGDGAKTVQQCAECSVSYNTFSLYFSLFLIPWSLVLCFVQNIN